MTDTPDKDPDKDPDNTPDSEPKFTDTRPLHCRVRQYDEKKGYNKYLCLFCGNGALNPFPCPHEDRRPGIYRQDPG